MTTVFYVLLIFLGTVYSQYFPPDFKFGVATSAAQTEGAWNVDGKGESIWDYQTHNFPERILDFSNADIACDSYNKIDEDIANLKSMKVDFYRLSISWTRILPRGFPNHINEAGVRHYRNLFTKLIDNGIEPVVTIYHWDMPQSMQEVGGWTNELMIGYTTDFAEVCFKLFGDLVKTWITINEPYEICQMGYAEASMAPYLTLNGVGNYLCGHNIILTHASIYHLYKKKFKDTQKGRVGITIESSWFEPYSTSKEDITAAENMIQFYFGWFANAIYSTDGDYPKIMRERIDYLSKQQGFEHSRLPRFTPEQVEFIRGASDYFGLNHYTTYLVKPGNKSIDKIPSFLNDAGAYYLVDETWEETARYAFRVVPWGLRKLLNWIKIKYNNPEVLITESGYAGFGDETVHDCERINYYNGYLLSVSQALNNDGCNIKGFTGWSYLDNFEWSSGYTNRFGFYYVNFEDATRTREAKRSVNAFRSVITTRNITTDLYYACIDERNN